MMGSTDDPADGGAVAATVFGAVAVYGVRITLQVASWICREMLTSRFTRLFCCFARARRGCTEGKADVGRSRCDDSCFWR